MSDQWGQQPPSPNQQSWGQQPSSPNQQPWGQQPPPPYQQPWGQQPPNVGWQQQTFYPGQFQPPQPPPKKKGNRQLWIILSIVGGVLILSCVLFAVIGSFISNNSSIGGATAPQTEADYKASTTDITVTNLDKDGSVDKGKEVHFTCTILNFVKDSTGNTAGANVTTQGYASIIQVAFTSGTDLTQLNAGDVLEVWGTDQGVFSGKNAFGATVQEVEIMAKYMNDQTTNYQANS